MQTVQSYSPLSSMLISNSNINKQQHPQHITPPASNIFPVHQKQDQWMKEAEIGRVDGYCNNLIKMSRLTDLSRVSSYVKASGGSGIAGKVILGASIVSALLGVKSYVDSFAAEKQIEFRKSQLKLPVYKLTEDQMVNPPWNHDNLDTWLYRRVQVIGRPIIKDAMPIACNDFDSPGYEEVVPLVTREDKNFQNRQGLLFNRGWVNAKFRHPTTRPRIEEVHRQKYVCFVSKMSHLRNKQWFNGNAYQKGRELFNNADLQDMGKRSLLLNQEEASVAVLERLAETGVYDERSSQRRGCDAQFSEPYPWARTEAGALQLDKMPWDLRNEAGHYLLGSLFGFVVGASIF